MMKLSFKQWYAIIALVLAIIFGLFYIKENRYKSMDTTQGSFVLDTWTGKIVDIEKMLPEE